MKMRMNDYEVVVVVQESSNAGWRLLYLMWLWLFVNAF